MPKDAPHCADVTLIVGQDDDSSTKIRRHFEEVFLKSTGKPFVFDNDGMRTLHFDEKFVQSAMRISDPDELLLSYTRAMMGFLLFNPSPSHIIMIGLGGGSLAKYCYRRLPNTRVTVLELNADVIALRDQFMIPADDERFQVIHVDAAQYLATCPDQQADIILHDGFNAEGLARELCTTEFYKACERVLTPRGVLVSNLWGDSSDLAPLIMTLHAEFDWQVWWCNASRSCNCIVFSSKSTVRDGFHLTLSERAQRFDGRLALQLSELVDRMYTACDTACAEGHCMS